MNKLSIQIHQRINEKSCIVFDLWWVVFRFSDWLKALSEKTGIPQKDIDHYWHMHDPALCRWSLDPQDFLKNLYKEFSIKYEDFSFLEFWISHFSPIISTHETIYELKSVGIDIHILSNIYPWVFQKLIGGETIPHIPYKTVIESCAIWYIKPEIEIFEYTELFLWALPKDILFIDDNQENITTAKARWWEVILFQEENL